MRIKTTYFLSLFLLSTALSACKQSEQPTPTVANDAAQSTEAQPVPNTEIKEVSDMNFEQLLPEGFIKAGQSALPSGDVCVVGSQLSDDGNESARVYLVNAKEKKTDWQVTIPMDPDFYQNRVTHCACDGATCYALVATDTQSQQSLSQTLLSVAAVSIAHGKLIGQKNIDSIPNAEGSVTAWVEQGANNFVLKDNKLDIQGKYRNMDSDNEQTFSLSISTDLK